MPAYNKNLNVKLVKIFWFYHQNQCYFKNELVLKSNWNNCKMFII